MTFKNALRLSTILALGLSAATAAQAADMPGRALPAMPNTSFASPVYAPSWTGFYVGGNVGGAFMDKSPVSLFDRTGDRVNVRTVDKDANSVTFGGGLGYNYQVGSFVVGVEADYNYARLRGKNSYDRNFDLFFGLVTETVSARIKNNVDSYGTARGRIGFLATPQMLLYGTGGLAFGDTTFSGTGKDELFITSNGQFLGNAGGPYNFKKSSFNLGWTAGGGVEYALNPNWTVKAEGLYVSLDGDKALVKTEDFGTVSLTTREREFVVGRLGVNYKW